jgi:hypothetical protein
MNDQEKRKLRAKLQSDPAFHIEHIQGVTTLEPYQRTICDLFARNPLIAVAACHDVGKTWLAAKLVLAFGSSFPASKIVTTAPTWLQVESLLWSEIRAGYSKSKHPLGGRMLNTEWKIGDDWFAIGLSPKEDADNAGDGQGKTSGFQGFHAPHILLVFDEATGVPSKRWLQAHGMLTSANVHMLAIGNPTSKNTEFAKCFKSRLWKKVTITCFDSPNLKINEITNVAALERELTTLREMNDDAAAARIANYKVVQPALLTLQWVVDRALAWGLSHPLFVSKALGAFPEEDDNALFTLGSIELAQTRIYIPTRNDRFSLGIDVARFGSDRSVLTSLWGRKIHRPTVLVKRDTTQVVGQAVKIMAEFIQHGVDPTLATIAIDGTGVGAGVVDGLKEQQRFGRIHHEVEIRELHFGQGFAGNPDEKEREYDTKHYANLKAKMMVRLAQDIKTHLALPNENSYCEELPTILYTLDSKGRYVIESKDEYKSRTGLASPDFTDSLALANEGIYSIRQEVGLMRVLKR